MPNAPFPIQPELTAIAIAYRNQSLIADSVLPRVPVGKKEFKYLLQTLAESFTVPNTRVGRKSRPNQVDFTASEQTSSTIDYALDDPIPQEDLDNQPPNYDVKGRATEGLMDLIMLDREVRVANLVFASTTYPNGFKTDLSGSAKDWSEDGSDPIGDITEGLDACILRPNVMVIGRSAFTTLSVHPDIVKAANANSGDSGIVTRQKIAAIFELEEVLVGEGWVNTAKKGQAATMSRVWGKHASLIYRNKLAGTRGGATFGLTAEFGSRIAGSIPDPNIGMKGGEIVRTGESVKELITASSLGYFIENCTA